MIPSGIVDGALAFAEYAGLVLVLLRLASRTEPAKIVTLGAPCVLVVHGTGIVLTGAPVNLWVFAVTYSYTDLMRPKAVKRTVEQTVSEDVPDRVARMASSAANTPCIRPSMIKKAAMYCAGLNSMTSQPAITTITVMNAVSTINQTDKPSTPR